LWMLTNGNVGLDSECVAFIRYGGADADSQVKVMLREATAVMATSSLNEGDASW
jgi:hypothetical protein